MKTSKTALLLSALACLLYLFISACSERESVSAHIEKKLQEKKDKEHGHSHGDDSGHSHKDGNDHAHEETAHHGIIETLWSGQRGPGYAELKLHDDKGDLELWLTSDKEGAKPFDIALDSEITITFSELNDKTVTLRARNNEKNEDEDGKENIREGKTNYFIFPGDTGVDASFLTGKDFVSKVVIFFKNGETRYVTDEFELSPHTH